ncbi:MAG: hypothetical protein AAF211_12025 [Myxococcota bacterium]
MTWDLAVLFGVMAALGLTSLLMALPLARRSEAFFWSVNAFNGVMGLLVIGLGLPGFEHLTPVVGRLLGLVVGGLFLLHLVQSIDRRTRWKREDRLVEIEEERARLRAAREARDEAAEE